ncbi:MAG: ATP-dependent DNA helicase RecG [Anaplasma sp.]
MIPQPLVDSRKHDVTAIRKEEANINIFSSIYNIPGVNNEKGSLLEKLCGGCRIIDLLLYAPHGYVDRTNLSLSEDSVGRVVTFIALVRRHVPPSFPKMRRVPYKVLLESEIGAISLVFFNYSREYLKRVFKTGCKCVVSGKLERQYGRLQITHPDYATDDLEQFSAICGLEPLYAAAKGLHSKAIHKLIKGVMDLLPDLQEWINPGLMQRKAWYSWKQSIKTIHDPIDPRAVPLCRGRLAYDELLGHHAAMYFARQGRNNRGVQVVGDGTYRKAVMAKLGFELTDGQKSAIEAITRDQASNKQMTMLLQGDVGSGKTVVALFAILNAVESGGQVALMVPTEMLAEQHCTRIRDAVQGLSVRVELLTGSTKDKERLYLAHELLAGKIHILVGTHALFQESVAFRDLRLVVIDEQQRFGVLQRMRLIEKGKSADILFITATPIPRTLEQILYGNMDRVTITEKPKCRRPIRTSIVQVSRINEVCSRLASAMSDGHKVYWICPRIGDGNESEEPDVASVENRFALFKKIFGSSVGISHGALSRADKDESIRAFHAGDIKMLVATTVIEVGIDVPDATIIVIENPERLGLSQLHQLRGRVGRGDKQSFCILLHGPIGHMAYRKLNVLRDSQDGFFIAEQDLMLRGGGDVLGCKQSGAVEFRFANPFDINTMLKAHSDACKMVTTEEGRLMAYRLMEIFGYSLPDMKY